LLRFSVKPFFKRVEPQPLRRLITPIGFGDKILKLKYFSGFRSSLFSKGLRASSFFKRVAGKQFFQKGCDHADHAVFARFFGQAFSKKACGKSNKVYLTN